MRYVSVCSGIEACSVAWEPLGWEAAAYAEIDVQARAVLKHRFPDVPLETDFRDMGDRYGPVRLLAGGTPCQSFSIAGKRRGTEDQRGHLSLEFPRLARRLGVDWVVWENVPGVRSLDDGYAFRRILREFVECGFHVAWRQLNGEFVRVAGYERALPQRRSRVLLVGHSRNWRCGPAVLFEAEGGKRDTAPRREAREDGAVAEKAPCIIDSTLRRGGERGGVDGSLIPESVCIHENQQGALHVSYVSYGVSTDGGKVGQGYQAVLTPEVCPTVSAKWAKGSGGPSGDECQNLIPEAVIAFDHNEDGGTVGVEVSPTMRKRGKSGQAGMSIAYPDYSLPEGWQWVVRRMTPREVERVFGFPDDWTLVPRHEGDTKLMSDSARYRLLGNSMMVNKMRWVGQRIQIVDRIERGLAA